MWIILWERPQCVPAKWIAGYQGLGGGGERERKKKEVYSYKLLNGNFSHTLLTWQKYFGFLMAALFTAQQAPGFPSYMSFSSLHCAVWKWQAEKKACLGTSSPCKKADNEHLISNGSFLIVRSYGKINLFYICHW